MEQKRSLRRRMSQIFSPTADETALKRQRQEFNAWKNDESRCLGGNVFHFAVLNNHHLLLNEAITFPNARDLIRARDARSLTPLDIAVTQGMLQVVSQLLDAGACVREKTLLAALRTHDSAILRILLAGPDPASTRRRRRSFINIEVVDGKSLLDIAIDQDEPDKVAILVGAGAHLERDGTTILHAAIRSRKEIVLRHALANRIGYEDIDQVDDSKYSPFELAVAYSEFSYAKLIAASVPSLSMRDLCNRYLSVLVTRSVRDNEIIISEIIGTLIDKGGDLNSARCGDQPLLERAIRDQNTSMVSCLLERGADPNVSMLNGRTPLFLAVEMDLKEVLESLLRFGADINHRDDLGQSPLFTAVALGQDIPTQLLIRHRASLSIRDKAGETVLFHAVRKGYFSLLAVLIQGGGDIDILNLAGDSVLHVAAQNGNPFALEILLRTSKTHISTVNQAGYSPLRTACAAAYHSNAITLINAGADCNTKFGKNSTALHHAVAQRQPRLVTTLIEHGADLNAEDSERKTPLDYAAMSRTDGLELCRLLLSAGARLNTHRRPGDAVSFSPIRVAIQRRNDALAVFFLDWLTSTSGITVDGVNELFVLAAAEDCTLSAVKLLDLGAVPDQEIPGEACTSLPLAISRGNTQLALALLRCGSTTYDKDTACGHPLMLAINKMMEDVVGMILTKPVNLTYRSPPHGTFLHAAVAQGNEAAAEILLQRGIDPDARDFDGKTPLLIAVAQGRLSTASLLLANGADPNSRQEQQEDLPIHVAVGNGNLEMTTLLLDNGASPEEKSSAGKTPLEMANVAGSIDIALVLGNRCAPNLQDEGIYSDWPLPPPPPAAAAAASTGDVAQKSRPRSVIKETARSSQVFYRELRLHGNRGTGSFSRLFDRAQHSPDFAKRKSRVLVTADRASKYIDRDIVSQTVFAARPDTFSQIPTIAISPGTPLHPPAEALEALFCAGKLEEARSVLQQMPGLESTVLPKGVTMLQVAVFSGDIGLAKLILHKVSVSKAKDKTNALDPWGRLTVSDRRGADPERATLVAIAMLKHNDKMRDFLLDRGFRGGHRTASNSAPPVTPPLYLAVSEGNVVLAEKLMRNGDDPRLCAPEGTGSLVLLASSRDDAPMVEALLEYRDDRLSVVDRASALSFAMNKQNPRLLRALLTRATVRGDTNDGGDDANDDDAIDPDTPLDLDCKHPFDGPLPTARERGVLTSTGMPTVSPSPTTTATPIATPTATPTITITPTPIPTTALPHDNTHTHSTTQTNPNTPTNTNTNTNTHTTTQTDTNTNTSTQATTSNSTGAYTPLMLATMIGNTALVHVLLEHRATVNARDPLRHQTALHMALLRNQAGRMLPVIEALARAGADPTLVDIDGVHALHVAVLQKDLVLLETLLVLALPVPVPALVPVRKSLARSVSVPLLLAQSQSQSQSRPRSQQQQQQQPKSQSAPLRRDSDSDSDKDTDRDGDNDNNKDKDKLALRFCWSGYQADGSAATTATATAVVDPIVLARSKGFLEGAALLERVAAAGLA